MDNTDDIISFRSLYINWDFPNVPSYYVKHILSAKITLFAAYLAISQSEVDYNFVDEKPYAHVRSSRKDPSQSHSVGKYKTKNPAMFNQMRNELHHARRRAGDERSTHFLPTNLT